MKGLTKDGMTTFPDKLLGRDDTIADNLVRQTDGLLVTSYRELAAKIATLQFENPHLVLLFRGQHKDHRIDRNKWSMIRPTIFTLWGQTLWGQSPQYHICS